MKLGRLAFPLAAALALAGCATSGQPPQHPAERPGRPISGTVSAATYVAQTASIDLFELRSSQLALTRSANPRIQALARRMATEHRGLASQLSFAGRRLNLLPSATLLPRHQAMLDELVVSSSFDATYRRQQLAIHGASLSLHQAFAARGSSPTLRPVAANAARVEEAHLKLARAL